MKLIVFVLLVLLVISNAFMKTRVLKGYKNSIYQLQSSSSSSDSLSLDDLGKKIKVISFGQSQDVYGIEVGDRLFTEKLLNIPLSSTKGGFGLDLVELYTISGGLGNGGLVLLDSVVPGSNAEKAGLFMTGDLLVSISDGSNIVPLEGFNYDATIDRLLLFKDKNDVNITIKRVTKRKEIVVQMVGPSNEDAGSFVVLSGYGSNMRTALNSKNMRIYDDRTARFDSPYQTGNCAGEGTCGTCVVQVLEGKDLLNPRKDVEDKGLKKQGAPNNYRWSCRVAIGPDASKGGIVKIKLRPQSASW
jgi:hypothetical protein